MTTFFARFFTLLSSYIQNAEHPHLYFPQDSFFCSCSPFFFPSAPLFTLCFCLFSTTSAQENPSKDEKEMGSKTIPLLVLCMEACHFWENSPTGTTAIPVALDKDVMLLRQPFLIVFWDAEQTRWIFFGLSEGHSRVVALSTGYCHS